jgi:hypothetical protein
MAQNTFINVVVDPSAANKVESTHVHSVSGSSTASSGDLTLSYDSAKVTSLAILLSLVKVVMLRVSSGGLK